MIGDHLRALTKRWRNEVKEFGHFVNFLFFYTKKHVLTASFGFEGFKNRLVKLFLVKRGRYNRPFLHITTMLVLVLGVLITPYLADTFPLFSPGDTKVLSATSLTDAQSINVGSDVLQTEIAPKPRASVLSYTVEKGDTLSSIAKRFGISQDTIRWANNLTADELSVGDQLQILPVTGVSYKVQSGDTVYTIAKKYGTDAQQIVDFPFNTFGDNETFPLVAGQILIVPNGVKPSEKPSVPSGGYLQSQFAGPIPVASGGFSFPIHAGFMISQYASWYHMALDIAAPFATPIYAAHSGTASVVDIGTYDGGYGNNVYVDDGDGYKTHYAHMSEVDVTVGQQVIGGQTVIGHIGLTGRTTGAHVHFEILRNGVLVDPLPYVGD